MKSETHQLAEATCTDRMKNLNLAVVPVGPKRRSLTAQGNSRKPCVKYSRSLIHRGYSVHADLNKHDIKFSCDNLRCRSNHKRSLLQTMRKKWKNYFKLKSIGRKKSSQTPEKQNEGNPHPESYVCNDALQLNEISLDNFPTCVKEVSVSDFQGTFDNIVKALSLCVPNIYGSDTENDESFSNLQDRFEDGENVNELDRDRPTNQVEFKEQVFPHPEGEELICKKKQKLNPVKLRKTRKQSCQYPDFYETTWEFQPEFKLISPFKSGFKK